MNRINYDSSNYALFDPAVQAARKIGKIEIDHGKTSCKTYDADAELIRLRNYTEKKRKTG